MMLLVQLTPFFSAVSHWCTSASNLFFRHAQPSRDSRSHSPGRFNVLKPFHSRPSSLSTSALAEFDLCRRKYKFFAFGYWISQEMIMSPTPKIGALYPKIRKFDHWYSQAMMTSPTSDISLLSPRTDKLLRSIAIKLAAFPLGSPNTQRPDFRALERLQPPRKRGQSSANSSPPRSKVVETPNNPKIWY
ncbi:hypothetical protein C8R43DRAFT_944914 [Mycena crocata]|nr:hypothetical protein C8R43DRAFT_944914 [Mycena crocata]